MGRLVIIMLLLMLQGCRLYGGGAYHDVSFDSEFKEKRFIAKLGASQEFIREGKASLHGYIEHDSMPGYPEKEKGGSGLNAIGAKFEYKLY